MSEYMENIGVEWQHCQNQLLGRFGSAVGWNKKQPKKHVQPCHFHRFLTILIENTGGKDFNEFLTDIQSF